MNDTNEINSLKDKINESSIALDEKENNYLITNNDNSYLFTNYGYLSTEEKLRNLVKMSKRSNDLLLKMKMKTEGCRPLEIESNIQNFNVNILIIVA